MDKELAIESETKPFLQRVRNSLAESSEGDTQKDSQKNPLRRMLDFSSGKSDDAKDPLNNPYEAFGYLVEDKYKAEVQLVDRYQSFVAELLRLSLLGIAVFGWLYKQMFADLGPTPLLTIGGVAITIGGVAKTLAAFGVLAFGGAAVAALIFRFAATEGARYYIEGLRLPYGSDRRKDSLTKRREKIGVARWSKPLAGFMLGLGGVLVAVSLALLLFTDDIPKQIDELGKLHTSGVITEDEFEAKKSQLLARL